MAKMRCPNVANATTFIVLDALGPQKPYSRRNKNCAMKYFFILSSTWEGYQEVGVARATLWAMDAQNGKAVLCCASAEHGVQWTHGQPQLHCAHF